ncbi:MAG: FecR family protein [Candidatus Cloacimonetes bacterium]|jgi:hypothetical protein|nr:FecR family protein [Candidatus Cloacimonadota bacterium]MDY0298946.1 FecR family protein [Candidatus Cloacimonadaceae bacterium]MCB5278793.1 FecR family protein [Candidatus Cloacimonadota bacterium]MCK9333141.1 FecR family protein [Candidatus Cloacimonadota bacterium]MDD2210186.1 FecR family protein [Candidatus Cloacimonadota bacterium]
MKRVLILSLILLVASVLLADSVAILSASKGKVDLERARKQVKFKKGELLQNKDVLRTGSESFAAYKFIDASSMIKLFSNSVVTINASKSGTQLSKKVNVNKGNVLTQVKKGTGAFTVQTPTTVASVKGTEFMTRVDDDGFSTFIVTDGEVELRILDTDEVKNVSKGNTAVIDPDGEVELRQSSAQDISEIEQAELEANQSSETNTILIRVLDKNGNIKHIEVTY